MFLKVSMVDKAISGLSIDIRLVIDLEKPVKMRWGGISLILEQPCERDLLVLTNEIFCEGRFERLVCPKLEFRH